MPVDELEVYVSRDGLGRAVIVRRSDGLFCIYVHARWSGTWMEDDDPVRLRYDDPNPEEIAEPETGLYGTLEDARKQIQYMPGFLGAIIKHTKGR